MNFLGLLYIQTLNACPIIVFFHAPRPTRNIPSRTEAQKKRVQLGELANLILFIIHRGIVVFGRASASTEIIADDAVVRQPANDLMAFCPSIGHASLVQR